MEGILNTVLFSKPHVQSRATQFKFSWETVWLSKASILAQISAIRNTHPRHSADVVSVPGQRWSQDPDSIPVFPGQDMDSYKVQRFVVWGGHGALFARRFHLPPAESAV